MAHGLHHQSTVTDAIKKADANYASFVARMQAAEEIAIQWANDASRKLHSASSREDQNAATVRPSK